MSNFLIAAAMGSPDMGGSPQMEEDTTPAHSDAYWGKFEAQLSGSVQNKKYPPLNIIKHPWDGMFNESPTKGYLYEINIACAGFPKSHIKVQIADRRILTVSAIRLMRGDPDPLMGAEFLARSLSSKDFRIDFIINDYTKVLQTEYKDGILQIKLGVSYPGMEDVIVYDIE